MIIVDTAIEAATDRYVRMYYSSGDTLLAIASSKIKRYWLLVVAPVADADATATITTATVMPVGPS